MFQGSAEEIIQSPAFIEEYRGRVKLVFTSPPFPLNRKKSYGNFKGDKYVEWLSSFAPMLRGLLTPDGSIVMEIGNAWVPNQPVMSTLSVEALLAFLKAGDFNLCQQFICYNSARLPGPIQWVNIERIRVKDSFTHVWWMSHTERPDADNRRVLREYSKSMKKLLATGKYNSGQRHSGHLIGRTSFSRRHEGAIPSNVLTFANTNVDEVYTRYCKSNDLPVHDARMPEGLADFFVRFLTKEGDIVLDPFAGSGTTGASAERLGRRWVGIEMNPQFVAGARGRFGDPRVW